MSSPPIPVEAELTLLRKQVLAFKRRRSVRFRCALATLGKLTLPKSGECVQTWLSNLSECGVGLNLDRPLSDGEDIVLHLKSPQQNTPITLAARVVHSTREADGSWRVGCELVDKLHPDTLDALL